MAKSKVKAKVDASVGPSNVEDAASNDAIAESAPSESVEVETEAAIDVPDKSEVAEKIEDANEVLEPTEEGDEKNETTDDVDQSAERDKAETKDDPDESGDEDEGEEEEAEEEDAEADDEETKENGKLESMAADAVPEGEKVEEGDQKGEEQGSGKAENTPNKKVKRVRKKKKATSDGANKPVDTDKASPSAAQKKDSKLADGTGLIFMCNAKTKKDCFQYKIFGLPESKKELVAKIYKGMRLFLFDVDLKLMYGIYRAASPGGYNIEPKAFKSAYPSQVRFNILSDCLPLPEEKFKAAIKANYFGRNKFNTQLSAEQVKSLCKLFKSAGKLPRNNTPREIVRAAPEPSSLRGKKRSRLDEPAYARDRKRPQRDEMAREGKLSRREGGRQEVMIPRGRERRERALPRERERFGRDIPMRRDPYPQREVYRSPPRHYALPPPAPLPPVPYAYDRPVDDYYYRREPVQLELRDPRVIDLAPRPLEPPEYRDPYSLYREPAPYLEPVYPPQATLPSAAYAPAPSLYYRY